MTKKIPTVKYKKAPQAPRRFKSSYMFFSIGKHKQIRIDLAEKGETVKVNACWTHLRTPRHPETLPHIFTSSSF
jgi:hypothetical protein